MHKFGDKSLKYGSRMALIGIGEIIFIVLLKAGLGYMTGMVVLLADALSSCADLLTLFATYVGLKISRRPADKDFKYGYYKAETLAALATSFIIIYFGIEIMVESMERITEQPESQMQYMALISVFLAIIVSFHLGSFLKKTGKQINSSALINSGNEKKMDILTELAVLIGVGANYFKIPYLEGAIGVIISLITLRVGYIAAKESLFFLLDYFNDPKLIDKISGIIKSKSRIVKNIKDIRMRRAGTFIFGEAFLEIDSYAQIKDLRYELNNLKECIMKVSPYIRDFSLFIAIPKPKNVKVAVPVKKDKGMQSEVAFSFEDTVAYIFVEVSENKIIKFYGKPFGIAPDKISEIMNFLNKEKTNIVINNDMHSLLYYDLRRLHNIEVYPCFSNVKNAENAVKLLIIDT